MYVETVQGFFEREKHPGLGKSRVKVRKIWLWSVVAICYNNARNK